jgi:hypothetical protein
MKATTAKEGLIAAKWILEHYGWCQKTYHMHRDGIHYVVNPISEPFYGSCLSGALKLVEYESDGVQNATYNQVYGAVVNREGARNIPEWNDRQGRTRKDVLALLDKLITEA